MKSNNKWILPALQYRNYRLFFSGQGVSLIGTWIQRIAMSWLVYRLTDSVFLLGLVGFTGQIPLFLLAPFTGVLADRMNRHQVLVVTQTLAMIQALILTFLVLAGTIEIWQIISLSIFLGFVDALDMPVRQSFMGEIVQKKDLGNAIALNSSIVNSAQLLGPSIAGLLIVSVGEGICFLLNGISYLFVILSLLAMNMESKRKEKPRTRVLKGVKEGFSYAFGFMPIRSILLLLGLVSLVGMPYRVFMPVFARDILHGGPHVFGFLIGSSGLGALVGSIYLASRKSVLGLEKWVALAACIFGAGLIGFSLSRIFWLSLFLILWASFGMMVQMASSNTILQTIVDEDKRGRVMSFYAMAFRGMAPFGSLLAGGLASRIGVPTTLIISGVFCILGSVIFAQKLPLLWEMVRPIYVRMGIVSEEVPRVPKAEK
ncbi:MAG: MFS transporter [Deltaproteobacteria bacterium RBG_13_47_9]|nr:MAG: MFS transporter [Deltaproteobacteria bacterium RBG_13_47_9]